MTRGQEVFLFLTELQPTLWHPQMISAGITGCCDSSTPANSLADTSQECPLQPVCLLACGILT